MDGLDELDMDAAPRAHEMGLAAWDVIAARMGKRLTALEFQLWAAPSQLLRAMEGPSEMFVDVAEYFERRRGGNTLCTVLDFALLQTWADAGIRAHAAWLGIEEMFDRDENAPVPRGINSIAYCQSAVLQQMSWMKEAAVGSRNQATGHRPQATEITLLIGLPRNGRAIYKARMQKKLLQKLVIEVSPRLGIALTVQPDEWQLSRVSPSFFTTEARRPREGQPYRSQAIGQRPQGTPTQNTKAKGAKPSTTEDTEESRSRLQGDGRESMRGNANSWGKTLPRRALRHGERRKEG